METVQARLLGALALDNSERAEKVLIARLDTKEIYFTHNVIDPPRVAELALGFYSAGNLLRNSETTVSSQEDSKPYMLLKVENSAESASGTYTAVLSDGQYILYAYIVIDQK